MWLVGSKGKNRLLQWSFYFFQHCQFLGSPMIFNAANTTSFIGSQWCVFESGHHSDFPLPFTRQRRFVYSCDKLCHTVRRCVFVCVSGGGKLLWLLGLENASLLAVIEPVLSNVFEQAVCVTRFACIERVLHVAQRNDNNFLDLSLFVTVEERANKGCPHIRAYASIKACQIGFLLLITETEKKHVKKIVREEISSLLSLLFFFLISPRYRCAIRY